MCLKLELKLSVMLLGLGETSSDLDKGQVCARTPCVPAGNSLCSALNQRVFGPLHLQQPLLQPQGSCKSPQPLQCDFFLSQCSVQV